MRCNYGKRTRKKKNKILFKKTEGPKNLRRAILNFFKFQIHI